MKDKIKKWFDSFLSEIGFAVVHVEESTATSEMFVETRCVLPSSCPWLSAEFLQKLSEKLDTMMEFQDNAEFDCLCECPEIVSIGPDWVYKDKRFRVVFKTKMIPKGK